MLQPRHPAFHERLAAWREAAAAAVDVAILAALIYVGRVVALTVLVFVDGLIRHQLLGQPTIISPQQFSERGNLLAQLRAQMEARPVILGRPALTYALAFYVGPATLILLYWLLLQSAAGGRPLGRILFNRRRPAGRGLQTAQAVEPAGKTAEQGPDPAAAGFVRRIDARLPRQAAAVLPAALARLANSLGGWRDLLAPMQPLSAAMRAVGASLVLFALLLAVATPALSARPSSLVQVAFEAAGAQPATVARLSLWLALAGLAIGWAAALAGAALTNRGLFLLTGVFYVFAFVPIGFASAGRVYWLVLPQWTLVLLAAMMRRGRAGAARLATIWLLSLVATFHTLRLTPLNATVVARSWVAVLSISFVLAAALGRVRAEVGMGAAFCSLLVVDACFLGAVLRGGLPLLAGKIYLSLSQLAGLLMLFWFVLGRNLVDTAIAVARAAPAMAKTLAGPGRMAAMLFTCCLGELFVIGELQYYGLASDAPGKFSPALLGLTAHQGIALAVLLVAVLLGLAGKLSARAAAFLFASWVFTLALVLVWFSAGPAERTEPAQRSVVQWLGAIADSIHSAEDLSAVGILTFVLFRESFKAPQRFARGSSEARNRPAAAFCYLGAFILLETLSHFGLASGTTNPRAPAAFTLSGFEALLIPLGLYAVFEKRVSAAARPLIVVAFAWGMAASVVGYFARAALGDPRKLFWIANAGVIAADQAAVVILALAIIRLGRIARVVDTAAIGAACGLGFAVAYSEALFAPLLGQVVAVAAALFDFSPGLRFAAAWFDPSKWNLVPPADTLIFYLLAPVSIAIAGLVGNPARGTANLRPRIVAPLAVWLTTAAIAAPLYWSPLLSAPLNLLPSFNARPDYLGRLLQIELEAIAYLALAVLFAGWFLARAAGHEEAAGVRPKAA